MPNDLLTLVHVSSGVKQAFLKFLAQSAASRVSLTFPSRLFQQPKANFPHARIGASSSTSDSHPTAHHAQRVRTAQPLVRRPPQLSAASASGSPMTPLAGRRACGTCADAALWEAITQLLAAWCSKYRMAAVSDRPEKMPSRYSCVSSTPLWICFNCPSRDGRLVQVLSPLP